MSGKYIFSTFAVRQHLSDIQMLLTKFVVSLYEEVFLAPRQTPILEDRHLSGLDRDRWRGLVNAVMNLGAPKKWGEFLDQLRTC